MARTRTPRVGCRTGTNAVSPPSPRPRGTQLHQQPLHGQPTTPKRQALNSYQNWHDYNLTLVQRSFSTSEPADEYGAQVRIAFYADQTLPEKIDELHEDIERRIRRLVSLKQRLEL
jgi:hypothetical protein